MEKALCAVKYNSNGKIDLTDCADSFLLSVSMNQISNLSDLILYRNEDLNANKVNCMPTYIGWNFMFQILGMSCNVLFSQELSKTKAFSMCSLYQQLGVN